MDQRQLVRFILVASIAFLAMSMLQPLFFPPPKQNPNPAAANAAKDLNQPQAQDPSAEPSDAEAAPAAPAAPLPYADDEPRRLIALGSFGKGMPDKLLVTLDSKGGAVRRVELNARFPNGKLRYYDQETRGGYLGLLDLTPHPRGCEVHFVGPGTPAELAGVQVGDVITGFNGKPVASPEEFESALAETRVGDEVELRSERGSGESMTTQAHLLTLEVKPLELMGPDTGQQFERDATKPSSYLLTLRKKVDPIWPELDPQLMQVNWKVDQREVDGRQVVEFSHEIPADVLAVHNIPGPLRVVKRYRLPEPTAPDDFDRNYHIEMDIEVHNLSDQPAAVTMELDGPTGTNIEGWWYQHKLHGRSSAVFYIAGARDIVAGAPSRYVFWGNAEVVDNYISNDPELQAVFQPSPTGNEMHFIAVDTLYFVAALLPARNGELAAGAESSLFQPYSAFVHVLDPIDHIRANKHLKRTTDVTFRVFSDEFTIPPAGGDNAAPQPYRQSFVLFAGPKEPSLLQKYAVANGNNLSEVVSYGWFAAFSKPLVSLLRFFYSIVHNYGIAIIMLTVIVRLLLMPISRKVAMNAQASAKMMQTLQPEIKRLAEKYKNDMEKRMRAQQELFAKHGFNPIKQQFGGCLMVLLQLPIFIGLYRGLSVDVALRGQPLIPGLHWCSDLAAPDQLLYWQNWMPAFLAGETGWFGPYLNLLPLVTIALFLVQTKMFMPPPTDDQQRMAQRMMTFMMIFMSVLFFKVPSGLCLYFITSSLWGMVERSLLPKPKTAETAGDSSGSRPGAVAAKVPQPG